MSWVGHIGLVGVADSNTFSVEQPEGKVPQGRPRCRWKDMWISKKQDMMGRAIAQAVSRRLPTAAARVQTPVSSCGIL
jgi:hypothetical protein